MPFKKNAEIKEQLLGSIINGQFNLSRPLPTIKDLAKSFAVNKMTIQKVTNQLKKEGVLRPEFGRGLFINPSFVSKNSDNIVLISMYSSEEMQEHMYPGNIVSLFENGLAKCNLKLTHFNISGLDQFSIIERLRKKEAAVIVLFEISSDYLITEIKKIRIPIISMDYNASHIGVPSVVYDNVWGGHLAVKHLAKKGHRKIAFIKLDEEKRICDSPFHDPVDDARSLGYSIAMRDLGLLPRSIVLPVKRSEIDLLIPSEYAKKPFSAAVLNNFTAAQSVCRALVKSGLNVPEMISILAFGSGARTLENGLECSLVNVPEGEMGTYAAKIVSDIVLQKRNEKLPLVVTLPVKITAGESVALHRGGSKAKDGI